MYNLEEIIKKQKKPNTPVEMEKRQKNKKRCTKLKCPQKNLKIFGRNFKKRQNVVFSTVETSFVRKSLN